MNNKQIDLSKMLFRNLKHRFPELELVSITESAENPNHIWVNIIMPDDEDREIAIREVASELSTNILLKYGYHITISSSSELEKERVKL